MRLIDADELKKALAEMWYERNINIKLLSVADLIDEAPTIEPRKSRPYGDCAKCIHTYGTLGCCITVNNEWVYDCDNGMAQYEITKAEPQLDVYAQEYKAYRESLSAELGEKTIVNDCDHFATIACPSWHERSYTHEEAKGMTDLISREDAIKVVRDYFKSRARECEQDHISKEEKNIITYNKGINTKLRELPSADRPNYNLETIADIVRQLGHLDDYIADTCDRPKGKWMRIWASEHETCPLSRCSNCNEEYPSIADNYNYCPCCGADMRGEKNE